MLVNEVTNELGIDRPLISKQNNSDYFYLTDGLNSVTELTDGSFISSDNSYTYDSFGNILFETGTLDNHSQYTGREYDAETGLYYYRARYYDPQIGRFITLDPIQELTYLINGIKPYNSLVLINKAERPSHYMYVDNNPISFTDPLGLNKDKDSYQQGEVCASRVKSKMNKKECPTELDCYLCCHEITGSIFASDPVTAICIRSCTIQVEKKRGELGCC